MAVLALDRKQKPLMPCSEKRARKLLACGRAQLQHWRKPTLAIKASGRGSYQRTLPDAVGFPRAYLTRTRRIHGFQTGDMVKASVTRGKKKGEYTGRVAVRASGYFNIQTQDPVKGVVQGISYRYCKLLQRADGYGYSLVATMDVTGTPPKPGTLRVPRSASPA